MDVETHGQTLRLLIHKQGGLSVADCQAVNHVVHPILEVHEHLANYAQLEVASPGIDRPLQTAKDFQRNCGRTVQIEIASESENEPGYHVQGTVIEVHPEKSRLGANWRKKYLCSDFTHSQGTHPSEMVTGKSEGRTSYAAVKNWKGVRGLKLYNVLFARLSKIRVRERYLC